MGENIYSVSSNVPTIKTAQTFRESLLCGCNPVAAKLVDSKEHTAGGVRSPGERAL